MMEEDLLGELISAAESLVNQNSSKNTSIKEINIFNKEENEVRDALPESSNTSVIHTGLSDSSDDEDNKYFEEAKYSEYGRTIKKVLATSNKKLEVKNKSTTWKSTSNSIAKQLSLPTLKASASSDVFVDPIFSIRIVNPVVSSKVLQERMQGRESVALAKLKWYIQKLEPNKDWVIAGVIVQKSASKTSQKGSQFCIWSISDLHGDLKTASVFLFGNAYQQLWKTVVGTVIGILNPNVLDKKDGSKDEACLSVDNHQKVMILGQSKDLGTCKSTKNNGEQCSAFINTNQSEYCTYHIKQEYQKYCKRSDVQSSFTGRGLTALRNKVLGKNEVFYAGKLYTAIPAKKSKKLTAKDDRRLRALKENGVITNSDQMAKRDDSNNKKMTATALELSKTQRIKDLQLLQKLSANELDNESDKIGKFNSNLSRKVSLEESKTIAIDVISKLKNKQTVSKHFPEDTIKNGFDDSINNKTYLEVNNANFSTELQNKDTFSSKNRKIAEVTLKSDEEKKISQSKISPVVNNINNNKSLSESTNIKITNAETKTQTIINSKQTNALNISVNTNKTRPFLDSTATIPSITISGKNNTIDLNSPIPRKLVNRAKLNALKYVQRNGQIKKSNPMSIHGTGKKRSIDSTNEIEENDPKKQKIQQNDFFSERFKKMMAATSAHSDLIEQHDNEEKEKYFKKLEVKEKMEEKMANTYKVQCKAVQCLKCKYTNFSASDKCKSEKHPLKVFNTFKRFFECGHCGNRTVCLEIIPTAACKNCGSSKWRKTSMMKEKNIKSVHNLSIRGGEQKFANSVIINANLDLLLPDD